MNEKVKSKAELLEQLKIDQDDRKTSQKEAGMSGIKVFFIAALCTGIGLSVGLWRPVWLFGAGLPERTPSATELAANTEKSSSLGKNPVATDAVSGSPTNKVILPSEEQSNLTNQAVLNGSGYVTARRKATVSAEMMGLITEVNVEEGMQVELGQVLARLDDTTARVNLRLAQARLDVLKAQLESAKASLVEAQSNHQRVLNNEFSSQADSTRVVAELARQQANIAGIEANLQVSQLEVERQQELLDDFVIKAPFSGIVTVKNAQPGEIVAPASAGGGFTRTGICTIVDMSSLEIEVDVNEAYIGRVSPGQAVIATLDAYPDWEIPATVIAIIPTADRAKATVKTRIGLDVSDKRILPDMGIKVAFLEKRG